MFVFKNHVDNVIEVVSLTDQHIFEEIESLGGSIFGNFKVRNYESNSSKTLNPTYGSAEAIKVLTLLNRNMDSWSKYKINSVSVHNIWEQKGEDFETDVLLDNYSKLTRYSMREGNPVKNNLNSRHFTDVVSKTMVKVKTALGALKTDRMNE